MNNERKKEQFKKDLLSENFELVRKALCQNVANRTDQRLDEIGKELFDALNELSDQTSAIYKARFGRSN